VTAPPRILASLEVEMSDPRPVSANHAYSSNGSRRFLTAAGKAFKDQLTMRVASATTTCAVPWARVVDFVYKEGAHVQIHTTVWLEDLYNKSWRVGGSEYVQKKTRERKARSPYQKVDAPNFVKLIEDAVAKGTGIDDSAHLDSRVTKLGDRTNPRILIRYLVCE
jgi:hypothetical protein